MKIGLVAIAIFITIYITIFRYCVELLLSDCKWDFALLSHRCLPYPVP